MKNYVLLLGKKKRNRLRKAGIVFSDYSWSSEKKIVISEGDLEKVLDLIHAEVVQERPTEREGVFSLYLKFQAPGKKSRSQTPPPFGVFCENFESYGRDDFIESMTEILLPKIKMDGYLTVPRGGRAEPLDNGRFNIFIRCSPVSMEAAKRPPREMWGIGVDVRSYSFGPSYKGTQIMTPEGWCVAELIENNLYIHHHLGLEGTSRERLIFNRILKEVVELIGLTPKEQEERVQLILEKALEKTREEYIHECSFRAQKNIEATEKSIARNIELMREYQAAIVKKVREINGSNKKLEQLRSSNGDVSKTYGLEFDKVMEHPKVIAMEVTSGVIKVYTDTLYCVDPRSEFTHEIGKFRIDISTQGKYAGVRWFNQTRKVNGHHAPHIFNSDGDACLGSMSEVFPELVGNYEFAAVINMAIAFVESVNVDDPAGKTIKDYPVVEAEKAQSNTA